MSNIREAQQAWDNAQPPETSLAKMKAQWQADALDTLADDLEAMDPQHDDVHLVAVSDIRARADELRRQSQGANNEDAQA